MAPSPIAGRRVVVLPDLFVDAIVRLPEWQRTQEDCGRIVARGGGNLPVGPIEFKLGGNAANVAIALARLGADVDLVARTDSLGRALLAPAAEEAGLRIRHVRESDRPSATLALECGGANLMLSHAGPLATFGPDELKGAEWKVIEAADAVVCMNWAQNPLGTQLLRAVSQRTHRKGIPLFVDTSDPRLAQDRIPALLGASDLWPRVTSLGVNENEVKAFTGDREAPLPELAAELSRNLGCPVDLHTSEWAAHVNGSTTMVPGRKVKPRRLTGAGDAWTAGNVAGYLAGLPAANRLRLAHAAATHYIRSPDAKPPRHDQVPASLWKGAAKAGGKARGRAVLGLV
ncbi:MAG TPA: carbohydrate kinase family protein [Candidatus Thermoplasmatota archaeon]|nr:carbohydrate kinase family protein [Candidatus Thermoplasmatota archaeon]